MTELTSFLREQTISGANKCMRRPLPESLSVTDSPLSIPERKALGLKILFEKMPVFIGEKELIVGTRTYFKPHPDNKDGHDIFKYSLSAGIPYLKTEEIQLFGTDQSFRNKTHYTPDYSVLLNKGIGGILAECRQRSERTDTTQQQKEFLSSVMIAYQGLMTLIRRYSEKAAEMSENAHGTEKIRLTEIASVCKNISYGKPKNFREAVQLLWFGHLGTIIESFEFINYGRLDVILYPFLKDTPLPVAKQLIECLLLKMYDQVDIEESYLSKYAAQLVVTLGGVLENGENAVNDVTMLFLDAVASVRLPEPEFNLRINSKNPQEFIDKAAQLSVEGCNFISYYNDDIFVRNLTSAGIPEHFARIYAFDLCQDINIPGYSEFFTTGTVSLAHILMKLLCAEQEFDSFEKLIAKFKERISESICQLITDFCKAQKHVFLYRDGKTEEYFDQIKNSGAPVDWCGRSPMSPLPYLSALFHGAIENACDIVYESYPIKEKGIMIGTSVEAVNSLAAIKKTVFDDKLYTLREITEACVNDFGTESQKIMKSILFNAPKWGNDDDYVDAIASDILNYTLKEAERYRTFSGGKQLVGIHQPHPVPTGATLMATPDGRNKGAPVTVTLTPQSGTMRNGPTAALKSATKIDTSLVQWNFCVMVNYFSSVFRGNDGKEILKQLITAYFSIGGLQHQPNIADVELLRDAQKNPSKYKDLIVRLWGVSAHFIDLPRELQDEMIARFA